MGGGEVVASVSGLEAGLALLKSGIIIVAVAPHSLGADTGVHPPQVSRVPLAAILDIRPSPSGDALLLLVTPSSPEAGPLVPEAGPSTPEAGPSDTEAGPSGAPPPQDGPEAGTGPPQDDGSGADGPASGGDGPTSGVGARVPLDRFEPAALRLFFAQVDATRKLTTSRV
ncbi:hypothetical protein T484DRAFT_1882172 [Baffinella frigidus]|nr:hypothetical protein T484DRAFT_1882172 [Cryptophyta sp. CCMP2293]